MHSYRCRPLIIFRPIGQQKVPEKLASSKSGSIKSTGNEVIHFMLINCRPAAFVLMTEERNWGLMSNVLCCFVSDCKIDWSFAMALKEV